MRPFAVILWNVFVILIGIELLLRIVNPVPSFEPINTNNFLFSDNPDLLFVPNMSSDFYKRLGDHSNVSDSNFDKKVIFLGDSVTYGWDVTEEDTFVYLLNDLSSSQNIINLAVPSYNFIQEKEFFKSHYDTIKPDVAIFAFCENDLSYSDLKYITQNSILKNKYYTLLFTSPLHKFLNNFQLYNVPAYYSLRNQIDSSNLDLPDILPLDVVDDATNDLKHFMEKENVDVRFVFLPGLGYENDNITLLKEILFSYGFDYLDLDAIVDDVYTFDEKKSFFLPYDGVHFSKSGHALVSSLLQEHYPDIFE